MRKFALIILLILSVVTLQARKVQKTTRKVRSVTTENSVQADTITVQPQDITFKGYDKPLKSARETVIATSHLSYCISDMEVSITYNDMQGRSLHQRTLWVNADLKPRKSQLITFPSWDVQKSFFYHRGQQPRTPNVTPYDIRLRVLRVIKQD